MRISVAAAEPVAAAMPEELAWDATGEREGTDLDDKKGLDMIYAARMGEVDEVKALLADGVPVGFRDASGWTALKWASSEGHEAVLALLLESGAAEDELESPPPVEGGGGGSSLHWAAYKGHVALVWRLLTCKPPLSPKTLDAEANTPLHLAAAGGHLLVLKTLLSEGVDVSKVSPAMVDAAPGGRGWGLVAAEDIGGGEAVLAIPRSLWMTVDTALASPMAMLVRDAACASEASTWRRVPGRGYRVLPGGRTASTRRR